MKDYIKNLQTPIVIVGLGKSGHAALNLLRYFGFDSASLKTFDAKDTTADFSDPQDLLSLNPKTLVVSPGVPLSLAWIGELKQRGCHVTSEISLAVSTFENEKIIGVTGALGKSTTVSILGAGVKSFDPAAFVGGNLGFPVAQYALDCLSQKTPRGNWVILELSSYQLENCDQLHLEASAITYLTANHLERYPDLESYYLTKFKIAEISAKPCLLNQQGGDLVAFAKDHLQTPYQVISKSAPEIQALHLADAALIGEHNQDNLALACALAQQNQWPASAVAAMKNFKGLEHRLENLGISHGVRYINDSKATALDSVKIAAAAAYNTLDPQGSLYLLLGGKDKNLPWQDLESLQQYSKMKFIFFGACGGLAQEKSKLPGPIFSTLKQALENSKHDFKTHDTVLLSPGGTSLDEFKSFEDRGEYFKSFVKAL